MKTHTVSQSHCCGENAKEIQARDQWWV